MLPFHFTRVTVPQSTHSEAVSWLEIMSGPDVSTATSGLAHNIVVVRIVKIIFIT